MKKTLNILLSLLVVVYPLAVYFGLHYLQPKFIGLSLIVLMLLRFLSYGSQLKQISKEVYPLLILGVLVGLTVSISNDPLVLKLYPCLISLSLLLVFGGSLWQPQTFVERIARITEPNLSSAGVNYTRKVTYIWCAFFIFNGSIALYTAFYSSLEVWTIYNGFISYLLMGTLFASEYGMRLFLKKRGSI